MSIEVRCQKCREQINQKAAVLHGPPRYADGLEWVPINHLCRPCYRLVMDFVVTAPVEVNEPERQGT